MKMYCDSDALADPDECSYVDEKAALVEGDWKTVLEGYQAQRKVEKLYLSSLSVAASCDRFWEATGGKGCCLSTGAASL